MMILILLFHLSYMLPVRQRYFFPTIFLSKPGTRVTVTCKAKEGMYHLKVSSTPAQGTTVFVKLREN